jgi:hypothetical protein
VPESSALDLAPGKIADATADETGSRSQFPRAGTMQIGSTAVTFALGAMWSVFVISFLIFDGAEPSKPADFAFYFSTFIAVPVAGYLALQLVPAVPSPTPIGLLIEILILALIAASTFVTSSFILVMLVCSYLIIVVVTALSPMVIFVRSTFKLTVLNVIWYLAVTTAVICGLNLALKKITPYLYWPYEDTSLGHPAGIGPDPARIVNGAIVALLVFAIIRALVAGFSGRQWTFDHRFRPLLWALAGALIVCLLMRPVPSFEPAHYSAYLGSLNLLRHGGWPFIDVFCQYGFAFLAYLPLGYLLPLNYAGAAIVTYIFNIAMLLVALGIVYRLVGECKVALPVASTLLIVVWLSLPYNVDVTPSVFGVRWLPTWMLALLLVPNVSAGHVVGSQLWQVLALNLCAAWSCEAHVVGVVIFGLHRALASRLTGAGRWRAVAGGLTALPLSLIGPAFFVVATLVARRQMPSYGVYLEFFQSYASGELYPWLLLAKTTLVTNIWLLFAFVYATIMFLALVSFMLGRSVLMPPGLLIGLSVLAITGIAQGVYLVGRSTQPVLAFVALPLYTILIVLFILFIDHVGRRKGLRYELALWGGMVIAAWPAGYAWDRIHTDSNYAGAPIPLNNASFLARCVDSGSCDPVRELRSLVSGIRDDTSVIDSPEFKAQSWHGDLVNLYRKWRDRAPAVAMLGEGRTRALMELDAQDALRANNLTNDVLSPTLARRHVHTLAALPAGSLVMLHRTMSFFETRLLCGLLDKYGMERVDSIRDLFVERIVPLDGSFAIGSPVIQSDGQAMLQLKDGSPVQATTAPPGTPAGRVEQFTFLGNIAIVEGWVDDSAAPGKSKTVVLASQNRIWSLARPSIDMTDAAGMNSAPAKKGFRLLVCGAYRGQIRDFRAYVWSPSGPAVELEYSSKGLPQ